MEALVMGWRLWLGIGFGIGSDFQVVRVGSRITVRGRLPPSRIAAIRGFVRDDLRREGSFALAGTFGPRRSLRLRWAGRLDTRARQRVRNVLVELLR